MNILNRSIWNAAVSRDPSANWLKALETTDLEIQFWISTTPDTQSVHDRDELYFIASGRGEIEIDGECHSVSSGDVISVEAGTPHRFTSGSSDMAIWVVFYGKRKSIC